MRNLKTVNYDDMFALSAPSPKWVWNAQGQLVEIPAGQPAFDHDPVTGEPLGQRLEGEATNVLLNSFVPATQTVSISDATTYTLSVYGSGSAEITAGGSGTATDGSPLTFTTTGTSVTVTVTGTLDVFQLETGSVATSPIETTGSAVTRAADIATIQNVDTAAWFNSDAFTVFIAYDSGADGEGFIFHWSLPSAFGKANVIQLYKFSGGAFRVLNDGDVVFVGNVPLPTRKLAFSYGAGVLTVCADGIIIKSEAVALPPQLESFQFGRRYDGAAPQDLYLEHFRVSWRALSAAELQELTS